MILKKEVVPKKNYNYLTDQIIVGEEEIQRALSLEEEGRIFIQDNKFNESIVKYKEALAIRKI